MCQGKTMEMVKLIEGIRMFYDISVRVQPAIKESYIVTVKLLDVDPTFKTRVYTKYENLVVVSGNMIEKRFLKKSNSYTKACFDGSELRHVSNRFQIPRHRFGSIMTFKYNTEEEMNQSATALEKFLLELLFLEYQEYNLALEASTRIQ